MIEEMIRLVRRVEELEVLKTPGDPINILTDITTIRSVPDYLQ
jgi:hypothetical protein